MQVWKNLTRGDKIQAPNHMTQERGRGINFSQLPLRDVRRPRYYAGEEVNKLPDNLGDIKIFHLEEGLAPFRPVEEAQRMLDELYRSGALLESMFHYEISDEPARQGMRERFGNIPYLAFSGGGSDEILERVITQLIRDPNKEVMRLALIGLTYQHTVNFAGRYGHIGEDIDNLVLPIYRFTGPDLNVPLKDLIQRAGWRSQSSRAGNTLYYLCNPGTPRGDSVTLEVIEKLAYSLSKTDMLLVDEAQTDCLPDEQSMTTRLKDHPNTIVVRSVIDKGESMPGIRVGIIAASKEIGERFDIINRLYPVSALQQAFANVALSKTMWPYIEKTRKLTLKTKTELLRQFDEADIKYLPTDPRVPILTVDGRAEGFHARLLEQGVVTASGKPFALTDERMSDRYVRMTIPADIEDIPELVSRISMAKAA